MARWLSLLVLMGGVLAAGGCSRSGPATSPPPEEAADGPLDPPVAATLPVASVAITDAESLGVELVEPRAAPLADVHVGDAVTHDEALAAAVAIQKAVNAGDPSAVNEQCDWIAFASLVAAGLPGETQEQRDYRLKVSQGFAESAQKAATEFVRIVQVGGSFQWVRIREAPEGPRILVRVTAEGGSWLAYHEFCLVRRPEGACEWLISI